MILQQEVLLATRNITRQQRRSAVAVLAVATGVAVLILAGGFIDWIYWSLRENTIGSRIGHIQVARSGYFDLGSSDPARYAMVGMGDLRQKIAALPGVATVAPRMTISGLISHGEATVSFLGEGVDPQLEQPFNRWLLMEAGDPLSGSDSDGVILGKGLADALGVSVGSRVVLVVNKVGGGITGTELQVRGVFSTVSKAYDDAALRISLERARTLGQGGQEQLWVVLLTNTEQTLQTAASIRSLASPRGLEVVTWQQLADFYNKTVALFEKQVVVLRIVIAALIVLSISNTFTITVLARTREIGTMLALGSTKLQMMSRFLAEGFLLGCFGAGIGILLGVMLAIVISAIGIPMPPPPGMDHGYIGQVRVSGRLVVDAGWIAIATTAIACVWPAWKASRLNIIDALRHGT